MPRLAENLSGQQGSPAPSPLEIFQYAYAVFSSSTYRARYFEDLVRDFPRLPLTSQLDLFRELARLGGEVMAYQLMETKCQRELTAQFDPLTQAWRIESSGRVAADVSFEGPSVPIVGKAGWSDDTVWIDAVKARGSAGGSVTGTAGFHNVSEDVWKFAIGGFQVCSKWLKDRRGRALSGDDVVHYANVLIGLRETIRLTCEIDEVIEAYGGWPDAFSAERSA